ncbi:hypothetical protein EIN_178220 [Entamoeba invadens IP1]|uniref:hypothetical protein n=1 Tax=Entamoeba invadens IP1 TaxID=370355 RepID=UPI0002C3E11C|nr:hypothetical protein EIN_178220 [Entamoeba invadens IP1]ELP93895.1 hypothetical protein EIN_178220 [Entamoeba invadens IP1]|eukprot:XP_004260666.1 hypothetical protein EIN_178220 [Entamoeba invadens IP1]
MQQKQSPTHEKLQHQFVEIQKKYQTDLEVWVNMCLSAIEQTETFPPVGSQTSNETEDKKTILALREELKKQAVEKFNLVSELRKKDDRILGFENLVTQKDTELRRLKEQLKLKDTKQSEPPKYVEYFTTKQKTISSDSKAKTDDFLRNRRKALCDRTLREKEQLFSAKNIATIHPNKSVLFEETLWKSERLCLVESSTPNIYKRKVLEIMSTSLEGHVVDITDLDASQRDKQESEKNIEQLVVVPHHYFRMNKAKTILYVIFAKEELADKPKIEIILPDATVLQIAKAELLRENYLKVRNVWRMACYVLLIEKDEKLRAMDSGFEIQKLKLFEKIRKMEKGEQMKRLKLMSRSTTCLHNKTPRTQETVSTSVELSFAAYFYSDFLVYVPELENYIKLPETYNSVVKCENLIVQFDHKRDLLLVRENCYLCVFDSEIFDDKFEFPAFGVNLLIDPQIKEGYKFVGKCTIGDKTVYVTLMKSVTGRTPENFNQQKMQKYIEPENANVIDLKIPNEYLDFGVFYHQVKSRKEMFGSGGEVGSLPLVFPIPVRRDLHYFVAYQVGDVKGKEKYIVFNVIAG